MSVLNEPNALNSIREIKKRLTELFKSKKLSDCYFRVGSTVANWQVFNVHKLILSMASPVFEVMFYGKLAEKIYPIDVPDIEAHIFEKLILYIYTDQINVDTVEEAIDTTYAAEKYMLTPVVDHCVTYIKSKLNASNVCRVYEFTKIFDKEDIKLCCIPIIQSNINLILNDPGFLEVNINTLKDFFNMDNLELRTELPLFNALERYANTTGLLKDDCKLYKVYRKLLKSVRFLTMTPKQFADGPGSSKLLQPKEKFAILMNISSYDVKNIPMPEGFNTDRSFRFYE